VADIQKYLVEFHDKVKLDDENETLRDKRDKVLKKLKQELEANFEAEGKTPPTYTAINQGSYAMLTGVKPIAGDYDIDVALLFDIKKADHPDAVEVKKWVFDALEGHTKAVEMLRPCVRVQYQENGEPAYHVDLAVYSDATQNDDGRTYLARGLLNSTPENRYWEKADPRGLISKVRNRFSGDDAAQFRRVIRYLKRWKDLRFPSNGNAAPVGIGITISAYNWFAVQKTVDAFAGTSKYDDLLALEVFVRETIQRFRLGIFNGEMAERLEAFLPVEPYNDVFSKMTNSQMKEFKAKLEALLEAIIEAKNEVDPVEACEILRRKFGDDFPVPEKKETAQVTVKAMASGSSSA